MMRHLFPGITNSSPFLLALLEDENGINTAPEAESGHDITAVLDGDVSNPYVLNDYYQTNTNDLQKEHYDFLYEI
jgi:hypothetical protein